MQASWQRWIPLTGILVVILIVVGFAFVSGPEDTGKDVADAKLLDWYADSGNQTWALIGAYLLALASATLVVFVNRLRAVIHEAEGGRPLIATAVFAGGIVYAVGIAVAAALLAAVPGGLKFGDEPLPANADIVRFLPQAAFGLLLVTAMFPALLMILGTAIASMRYGIFPSWFAWLSIVCAIVLLFAALFVPMIALGVWLIAASIVLMRRQPATTMA